MERRMAESWVKLAFQQPQYDVGGGGDWQVTHSYSNYFPTMKINANGRQSRSRWGPTQPERLYQPSICTLGDYMDQPSTHKSYAEIPLHPLHHILPSQQGFMLRLFMSLSTLFRRLGLDSLRRFDRERNASSMENIRDRNIFILGPRSTPPKFFRGSVYACMFSVNIIMWIIGGHLLPVVQPLLASAVER
ncbi:hypothetical protein HO173_012149 [Letharia columbiana]|uniref:Uncharacterized protein n=1 Tax=Letharia columbiana TaxID=112416 RepID=A0A8H6CQ96_9LECA|nr:uncharacterized protein HO173_012149 [Letharia columbiana]KAF6227620.1 hypothetical protein HO173_012149 [Letharia columbiana]